VRLIDVAPTVADVINLEPFKQWEGKSMRAVANDDIEARKYAFGDVGRQIEYSRCCVRRADGWKLMRHGEDGEFCFNVRDFPDEKPEDDCSSSHPTEYSGLSEVLNNHQNQMERRRRDGSLGVAEEETMVEDHLRDLGYLE
jgi:arylsulfatase A-like enzyme